MFSIIIIFLRLTGAAVFTDLQIQETHGFQLIRAYPAERFGLLYLPAVVYMWDMHPAFLKLPMTETIG